MTTVRRPIHREPRGNCVTPRAVEAFREMLELADKCTQCNPAVWPTDCHCNEATQERWSELDGIIYEETPDRRPWEIGRMVVPPGSSSLNDVWTRKAIARWEALEAAVEAEAR